MRAPAGAWAPGAVWCFDVDGTLVDSHTGTSLRPGAVDLLTGLAALGCRLVLWSAGGADHARARAVDHGVDHLFAQVADKGDRDVLGHYRLARPAGGPGGPVVYVDDRPEDLPGEEVVVAVSPYLVHDPHDTGLVRGLAAIGVPWPASSGRPSAP